MARAFSAVKLLVWNPMNGWPAASFAITGLRCLTSCAESVPAGPAIPSISSAMWRYLVRLALAMSCLPFVWNGLLRDCVSLSQNSMQDGHRSSNIGCAIHATHHSHSPDGAKTDQREAEGDAVPADVRRAGTLMNRRR